MATGLSGIFSTLPRKLVSLPDCSSGPIYSGRLSYLSHGQQFTGLASSTNSHPAPLSTHSAQQSDSLTRVNKPTAKRVTCSPTPVRQTGILYVGGPGWHRISWAECLASPELMRFLAALDFCNMAIKVVKTTLA
ncbi:unnamed protein product [Protopolystoma xenopodis]|uniref:Uncharacterized protein n=1 Tax=Protopolystoma xenopodis TaxID=117903 RepID=A0A3S5FDG1_9PLAT|nr:unnamed protein product [Protopolystoma xenopodis]